MERMIVILPAAGRSVRFGGAVNKLQTLLAGQTVLQRSIDAFLRRADVACVIVATTPSGASSESESAPALAGLRADARLRFVEGGENRAQSVRRALMSSPDDVAWVAVHDAARPLVSQDLIDTTFAAAREHGTAVPALPLAYTVKQADGPLPARVRQTVPRASLWAMQTPQIMRRADLLAAYERCPIPLDQITDDAQLIELAGGQVWLIPGEEKNLKITTRADMVLAEWFLSGER